MRGADTRRLDQFAGEGMKLLNFAPEAQCTPSRSALMTGRYAIRSGNRTVPFVGSEAGLVAWERTMGDLLSANGYATACVGNTYVASIIAGDATFCAISTPLNAERCALGARPSRVALGRLCTTGPASGRRLDQP